MGRGSSGGGGARAGEGRSSSSEAAASQVSADVAGYSDLVTPKGVTIAPSGQIKMKAPKSVEQADNVLKVVTKSHDIATREVSQTRGLAPNDRRAVAAELRLNHVNKQLGQAIKWARKFK